MIWWLACSAAAPEPEGPLPPAHVAEWDALVRAAERHDLAAVQVLARDLSLGPVGADSPAADAFASALGFLQVAEDDADLAEGMSRARAACRGCHPDR